MHVQDDLLHFPPAVVRFRISKIESGCCPEFATVCNSRQQPIYFFEQSKDSRGAFQKKQMYYNHPIRLKKIRRKYGEIKKITPSKIIFDFFKSLFKYSLYIIRYLSKLSK